MKKVYFVLINWNVKIPSSVLEVASNVSQNMKSNSNFETPEVSMADFDKALDRAQEAYNNRRNGKLAQIECAKAMEDMDAKLRTQALYVNEASKYDQAIIETSGYKASKDSYNRSVTPDMPTNVKLTSKNSNVIMDSTKPKGAASMCWVVYTGDVKDLAVVEDNMVIMPANTSIKILPCGKAREVIKGLAIGTRVSVQVLAQNSAGKSALSELVTVFVNR